MREIRQFFVVLLAVFFFIAMYMLCDSYSEDLKTEYSGQISQSLLGQLSGRSSNASVSSIDDLSVTKLVEDMIKQNYTSTMTLTAAGDVLCRSDLLKASYDTSTGSFDFSDCFTYVQDILQSSDYTIATLKTTLAGSGGGTSDDYYGYTASHSRLNSPEILANNLKSAGVNLLNIATNHSLDSGASGLISTIDYVSEAGLASVGAAKDSSSDSDYSIEINGIQVGFLGYTNSTNDISLGSDATCVINTLNDYDSSKVSTLCSRITEMKKTCDLVVVMLNFGSVTSQSIETEQQTLAYKLCEAGADLILGTGSLVIKPMEVVTVSSGTGRTRTCLVFYGIGALLTAETYKNDEDRDIGAIYEFDILRDEFGDTHINGFSVTPLYMNWNETLQAIPLCEAMDTSKYSSILSSSAMSRIESAYNSIMDNLLDGSGLSYTYKDYVFHVMVD